MKQEQLMVCLQFLVQLNSDLLCVSQLPVCNAGTANGLIERIFMILKIKMTPCLYLSLSCGYMHVYYHNGLTSILIYIPDLR